MTGSASVFGILTNLTNWHKICQKIWGKANEHTLGSDFTAETRSEKVQGGPFLRHLKHVSFRASRKPVNASFRLTFLSLCDRITGTLPTDASKPSNAQPCVSKLARVEPYFKVTLGWNCTTWGFGSDPSGATKKTLSHSTILVVK